MSTTETIQRFTCSALNKEGCLLTDSGAEFEPGQSCIAGHCKLGGEYLEDDTIAINNGQFPIPCSALLFVRETL